MADATPDDIEDVRTLIPDTDAVFGAGEDEHLFTDDQISRFFRLGGGNPVRAAGLAMIAVGNSEALISKVIVTQDLETDGSKLQDKWRAAGEAMLKRADKEDVFDGFQIINFREGWLPYPPELTEPPFDGRWPYGW
jgi:hypothetical protein